MEASEYLFKKAVELGLCSQWQEKWVGDVDSLLSMYKKGIDFCIEHDYPDIDFVRNNFNERTESHDIYVDAKKEIEAYGETIICMGSCSMTIKVKPYAVIRIYLLHNSSAKISVSEGAIVMIDAYGQSSADVFGDTIKTKAYVYDNAGVSGCKAFNKERRVKSTFNR